MRPGVNGLEGQPVAEGVAEINLQRVIAGDRGVFLHCDAVVPGELLEVKCGSLLMDHYRLGVAVSIRVAVRISVGVPHEGGDVNGPEPDQRLSHASGASQMTA